MKSNYLGIWLPVLLIVSFSSVNASGQSLSSFDFLRLEPSAKAAALGGTIMMGASPHSTTIYYNPALPQDNTDGSLSVSWLNHFSDLQSGTVTYSKSLTRIGTATGGIRFFSWGRIDRANDLGEIDGSFSSSNFALSIGLSRLLQPRLRYGANIHIAYTTIAEFNALAIAFDAGAVYYNVEQGFTASVGVSNLGLALTHIGQTRDTLPLDVRIATSKRLKHIPILIGLTLVNLQDTPEISSLDQGFEHAILSLEFQAIPVFHVRMGYNHRKRELKSDRRLDLAGISIGFGLRLRRFHLDYSYSSWSFGGLHQFTVSTKL
ncbi:MAG: type IX secretion system protein PorQ [Bacteroidetes bacterium]|nr:type IX secretion system protein PorQ [Bacteroidota bacterium]